MNRRGRKHTLWFLPLRSHRYLAMACVSGSENAFGPAYVSEHGFDDAPVSGMFKKVLSLCWSRKWSVDVRERERVS